MNKVKYVQEVKAIFDLLGIKDVTKPWQKKNGTQVFELPFKTMWQNGSASINRFHITKSGYVRKMVVHPETGASYSCYQLNKVRKVPNYVKNYVWNDDKRDSVWDGNYRKVYNNERIMIDTHEDRYVYLCNYILKNYYRNSKMNLVGEYTQSRVKIIHREWWKKDRINDQLPFNGHYANPVHPEPQDLPFEETVERDSFIDDNEIKVIINGHRYNLS